MVNLHSVLLWIFLRDLLVVTSDILTSIQWSPQNEMFVPEKSCNKISVLPMDKLHFICPHSGTYLRHYQDPLSSDLRYQNMYMLTDEKQYRNCNATGGRLLMKCNDPRQIKFTGVVFSRHSASDDAPVFIPGKTYYIINTADGTSYTLDNRIGGSCRKSNMKLEIYVCLNSDDPKCSKKRGPLDCHEFEEQGTPASQRCDETTTDSQTDSNKAGFEKDDEGDAKARACTETSHLQFTLLEFVGYLVASFFVGFLFALLFCCTCCKTQPRKRGKCYNRMCGFCPTGRVKEKGVSKTDGKIPGKSLTKVVWYTSSV